MWTNIIIFIIGLIIGYGVKLAMEIMNRSYDNSMHSAVPPGEEYTCECGHRHLLVKEFGKCGKCWEQIHGGDFNI